MPKALYDIRNYPRRSGTSQPLRSNPALMGETVKIDERTVADFILFTQKLAQYLVYYNANNIPQGDWQSFLYNDITYHLATKAADKSRYWEATWKELMENVEGPGGAPPTDDDHTKYFTWRYDFLYSIVAKMLEGFANGSSLPQWQKDLEALYTTAHLNIIWSLLNNYYASSTSLLVNNAGVFSYKDMILLQKKKVDEQVNQYGQVAADLLTLNDPLIPNGDFIFGTAVTIPEKIAAASEYLDELAAQLISIYNGVNSLADKYLSFTLHSFDLHQPHVGLFYTYLQLSDEHRNEINGLLIRHLDFYYRQVLCVKEKAAIPAQAFVTFELAKNVTEHFIPASTPVSAGKDSAKKDVFYKTMTDILVNITELAEIRSFTFIKQPTAKNNVLLPLGLFACTAADSIDGKGKPLPTGQSWNPFQVSDNTHDVAIGMGLSFYAPLLHEAPGEERKFALQLEYAKSLIDNAVISFTKKYGTIRILTEDEPIELPVTDAASISNGNGVKISFTISGKTKLSKASPNASIIFGNKLESVDASFLDVFKMFQTARLVKLQLLLSNHLVEVTKTETAAGITDLSSAFPAFGGAPRVGSSFSVIEQLLPGRTVTSLTMDVEWSASTERPFQVEISFPSQPGVKQFIDNGVSVSSFSLISNANVLFTNDEIKVKLAQDLGHATYANDMTRAIMQQNEDTLFTANLLSAQKLNLSSGGGEQQASLSAETNDFIAGKIIDMGGISLPGPPYTPMIKAITLDVSLGEDIMVPGSDNLFHQYAHGIKKIKPHDASLVPITPNEGELYLGFKNIVAAQSLKILVQVEEGTADATLDNPDTRWQYLLNNEWLGFDASFIDDGTRGLIQSGILSVVLPDADLTQNTLLPAGLLWLRASVPVEQTNAVCKIVGVHPQAALVQFGDHENDAAYIGTNIPPGTITNLFPKQSAVKKVVQPYPGFGGRKTEAPSQLYTRTSERLRHKGRSVTAWDYENVILEAFPEVYKVKTLMHACQLKTAPGKIIAKAGHVLILVVPKTSAQSAIYKPLLSKSRLTAMYEFIRPSCSPFAKLSLINPLFEEVNINVEVSFLSFVKDRLFYENLLQEDIKRFLSPWAFDDAREPEFGGVVYKSALMDFIEELSYIDFVKKLEIIHAGNSNDEMAKASSPASILISADRHNVTGLLNTASNQSINTKTIAYC